MEAAPFTISVIICAYTEERWHDIVDAVQSLYQQSMQPLEIIVVVDHNTHLLEMVHTHLVLPQGDHKDLIPPSLPMTRRGVSAPLRAIENKGAPGLSGARNSGIELASGALIAFLDDDAVAEPDWLERLGKHCENPLVLGVGGTVEPDWLIPRPAWFPTEFYWVIGCTYQDRPAEPVVVRNPYGGCACIRREVFETVGGLRSSIGRVGTRPMGCEETELCIRAQHYWPEKVFLYEPQATIHHRIPATRVRWRYFCARCYAEGLSKAIVTRYVGAQGGLSSERAYTLRIVPRGVWRGIIDVFVRRDITGFLRAGAIIAGLLMTMAGYLVGSISQRFVVGHDRSRSVREEHTGSENVALSANQKE